MSLRSRLLILVVLVCSPVLAVAVYATVARGGDAIRDARAQSLFLARSTANEQRNLVEQARQLLATLSHDPAVHGQHREACPRLLAALVQEFKVYTTLGVTDPGGDVVCSAPFPHQAVSLRDRPVFQEVARTRVFSVGSYTIGRVSGRPSLGLGYPLTDPSGEFVGMVFAALDLDWLGHLPESTHLPEDATVTVVDRNGVILARLPDTGRRGQSAAHFPMIGSVLTSHEGTGDGVDLDGTRSVYGFAPLLLDRTDAFVVVALDRKAIMAATRRVVIRVVGGIVALLVLALILTWGGAAALVLRPVRKLLRTTRAFGQGQLGARVGPRTMNGEFSELAAAFDVMAETVQRRTEQAEQAEHRYRGLFERNLAGMVRTRRDGRFVDCNPAYARLLGYASSAEVMTRPVDEFYADSAGRVALLSDLGPGKAITDHEIQLRCKDGGMIWVLTHVTEVTDGADTILEATVMDITDRRRREETERDAATLREVAALANAAAHEINNPLTILKGAASLLSPEARAGRRVEQINTAIGRISDIVSRMMRITRLRHMEQRSELPRTLDIRRSSEPDSIAKEP